MKRVWFALCALALAGSLLGLLAVSHQQAVQTFGVTAGLPDARLDRRPASIVGLNVALEQYADLGPVFDQLGGFHWLRQTFPWDAIEGRAPGVYDWAAWDRIVAAATGRQHALIAVLDGSPAWARLAGAPPSAPPDSPEAFGHFAGAFARRYGASIDVYQIWDEPNIELGWGGQPPSAAGYAALLEAAYTAIHGADPDATVIAAALAPNVEAGPDNLSDLRYLQQLYDLGAGPFFDAAAGKPYGFYTGPDDRLTDPAVLNFSRFTLLRQVMVRNGDGHKLLWGSNFGWNTLASPWGQATPQQQADYTLAAFERAGFEWPWAGVMALEDYQPPLPPTDPHWGFALVDPAGTASPLLGLINARFAGPLPAAPGNYSAQHPAAVYSGDWKFSDLGADIPEDYASARATFAFTGTDLGLIVRRGDYRGYLYVEIDGQPANRLPRDDRGAYLVLTSPSLGPEVNTVPVASGLASGQAHTAVIQPDRGWDQWALAGFAVGQQPPDRGFRLWLAGLALVALAGIAGLGYIGRGLDFAPAIQPLRRGWLRLGTTGQVLLTALASLVLYWTSWLTWGNDLVAATRRFGDAAPLALTALTAGLFYYSPSVLLALAALAVLFVLFYLRLDLGLAFTAVFIPFYLQYRLLWQRGFSMVEVCTLLLFGAYTLRRLGAPRQGRAAPKHNGAARPMWLRLSPADWAVGAYLLVATLSLLAAEQRVVALREYRLVILEPVLFYAVMRGVRLDRAGLWRVVDFFVLGAVLVALKGLWQYVTKTDLITAEEGLARIRSVYGSPNNLALYLGRAWPMALAVAALSRERWRRPVYAVAAAILGLTTLLTYSKGALVLGVPAGLAVVLIGWLGRSGVFAVLATLAAGLAALPLVARVPRFAGLLDFSSGTSFFRLKLWLSAWRMFLDHPWLGVGPDNFLYQYRSRYILPEAWQEPNLSHPHNVALDFLSRLGALGFITGAWMLAAFWGTALRAYRLLKAHRPNESVPAAQARAGLLALAVGSMGLVADMLAHGLVDHSFFLVDLAFVFFLALAAVQDVERLARSEGYATMPVPQVTVASGTPS